MKKFYSDLVSTLWHCNEQLPQCGASSLWKDDIIQSTMFSFILPRENVYFPEDGSFIVEDIGGAGKFKLKLTTEEKNQPEKDKLVSQTQNRKSFFERIFGDNSWFNYLSDYSAEKIEKEIDYILTELLLFTVHEVWKTGKEERTSLRGQFFYLFQIKRLQETYETIHPLQPQSSTAKLLRMKIWENYQNGKDAGDENLLSVLFKSDFTVDDVMLASNYYFPKEVVEIILSNLDLCDENIFIDRFCKLSSS
jgi:hypothetical protein